LAERSPVDDIVGERSPEAAIVVDPWPSDRRAVVVEVRCQVETMALGDHSMAGATEAVDVKAS
jgi:hypothetical protein